MPNTPTEIGAVALLDEPIRRRLYEHVAAGRAVSRDEAAKETDVSRALAAFHLDRLVEAGLLVAEYRRLSGRTGPGAGRPAKLYRRAPGEVAVSFPERRYDVPALVFAETLEQVAGELPPDTLRGAARHVGEAAGNAARKRAGPRAGRRMRHDALLETLRERGYEPRETVIRRDQVRQLPVPRPRRAASSPRLRDEPGADGGTRRCARRRRRSPPGSTAGDVLRRHQAPRRRDPAGSEASGKPG